MTQKKTITNNLIWRFLERVGAQGVTFVVSVVLARILDPSVYGTISLVTVFTTILEVFISSGIGTALIQKKEADDLDFSTVFYFNCVSCLFLYALMYFAAPFIASFYNKPELTAIVRVLSLTLVISGVKNVQHAYVSRHMQFKKFFFATLGGTIGAAVVGIVMAINGMGVWALVAQSIFNHTVDTVILWLVVKWRPRKQFSWSRLGKLYAYGWKLLVSSLIDKTYIELRSLIIGKIYSSSDLAFYNRGQQFPKLIVHNINTSIDSVLLPTMSREQEEVSRVRSMTRRAIKISSFLLMPMMMGLAVCAEPLVRIILTEKWLPCVFFLRIFCFTYAFYPIHTANLNAIKAMGRSDLFLVLEIIKKIIGLAVLIFTMFISVKAMALSLIFTCFFNQVVNSWPNRKLLGYKYKEQLYDLFPQAFLSCVMGVITYSVTFLWLNDYLTIIIQVLLGVSIYVMGSKLMHIDSLEYVLKTAKEYLGKRRK